LASPDRKQILVIEDEPDIGDVIKYRLTLEGFAVSVVVDGQDGWAAVRQNLPDLVVLDLMLPSMGGLEICRCMRDERRTAKIPIVMVTAKGEESDICLGLELGADDYLTKPFSPKELVARIQAVLRRVDQHQALAQPFRSGPLTINAARHEATVNGAVIPLTATEFKILQLLAGRPGRVFTRQQISARAVSEEVVSVGRNIDVHVRAIRRKLDREQGMVETVRGVGYRFRDQGDN
jgi:DNA-binding response OmpR family regulator